VDFGQQVRHWGARPSGRGDRGILSIPVELFPPQYPWVREPQT
jgi:hypothetical protein